MFPSHPPLPTPWNLPFHPDAGIHTSIRIRESSVGLSVAATRHKPGNISRSCDRAPGGVYGPAGTNTAVVITVSGKLNARNVSHDAGVTVNASPRVAAARSTVK